MYDPAKLRTVDPLLTNMSLGYTFPGYFGEMLFPITRVTSMSARYRVFGRENWLIFPSVREPGSVANEVEGGKWSEDSFSIVQYALQSYVTDEEREEANSNNNAGELSFLNPEGDATELITRSVRLQHEQTVANAIRNVSSYGAANHSALSGTSRWDDYTTLVAGTPQWWQTVSDPVTNLNTAIRAVYDGTGRLPNTFVLPRKAWASAKNHPRVTARYNNFELTNPNALLDLLDLTTDTGENGPAPRIIVPNSGYNAADNVDATENFQSFWGNDVFVGLVDPQEGMSTKTFGKTFARPYDGNLRPIDRWREEARKSDVVRIHYRWDLKIVSNVAGYLLQTAVS